ncbi:MAG TPA: LysR substrate-binding domain-containing protein [Burkholderiaceae bacterium]|nr:LysR substrate-binding domain-containing protein [Burkholderiaceae bacterium]
MAVAADDLILFAQVIDAGSFSRAAERSGLPKSTVSRRISALETALGERLLTRTTRQLKITEFGEGILDHAQRLLEELEGARALAQHRQATPQGVLRASLPPDFFLDLDLLPFLLEFAERYPAVQLELDFSPRRVDLIAERFDLAIRVAARLPDDATLVARRLAVIEHGLYASCAYLKRVGVPKTPDDLLQHTGLRLIASSGEAFPWLLSRGDERWQGTPSGPVALNSIGLQRSLLLHGMGISDMSNRLAAPLIEQELIERVLPDWSLPSMTVWGVTAGRRLLPTRTAAFLGMLEAKLADC